jgi:hypothetical protein
MGQPLPWLLCEAGLSLGLMQKMARKIDIEPHKFEAPRVNLIHKLVGSTGTGASVIAEEGTSSRIIRTSEIFTCSWTSLDPKRISS